MSTSTSPEVRCPGCSAHVCAGSEWCTLCYADLRPPSPAPAEVVPAPGRHARNTPADDTPDQAAPTTASVGTARDIELVAARMLAELAVSESANPLGPLAAKLDTPAKRVGLMISATVGLLCVLTLLMAIAGALL